MRLEAETPIPISGLRAYANQLDEISKRVNKAPSGGGLFGTLLAFGPALAPFGGAAVGMLGSISAGAVEAAAGVGVLAVALKGLDVGVQSYEKYQKSVSSADFSYRQALAAAGTKSSVAPMHGPKGNQVAGTSPRDAAIAAANAAHAKKLGVARHNLDQSAYGGMSKAGQAYVENNIAHFQPFKKQLQQTVQDGALPGLTSLQKSLVSDAPQITAALGAISTAVGSVTAKGGHALQSPFWRQFLVWFGHDTARNVGTMGHAIGQVVEALARMDQRSGGPHKLVDDIDHLATKLNHWSASPQFLTFLQKLHEDEHQAVEFFHAFWAAAKPVLDGMKQAGGGELQMVTSALSTIASLPTGFLTTAGRMLPLIFLALKANDKMLGPAADGFARLTKSTAKLSEEGLSNIQIFRTGAMNAFKSTAGPAGIGLLIDGLSRGDTALGEFESTAGVALAGFAVGNVWGAALATGAKLLWDIGDALATGSQDVAGFERALERSTVTSVTKNYQDLADTLNKVTLAYTGMTRAKAFEDSKKPVKGPDGKDSPNTVYSTLHAEGFTDRQITDITLGTADPKTKKQLSAVTNTNNQLITQTRRTYGAAGYQTDDASLNLATGGEFNQLKEEKAILATLGTAGHDAQVRQARTNAVNLTVTLQQFAKALGDTHAAQAAYESDTANTTAGMAKLLEQFGGLKKFDKTRISALIAFEGGPTALLSLQGVIEYLQRAADRSPITPTVGAPDTAGFWNVLRSLPGFGGPVPHINMDLSLGGLVPQYNNDRTIDHDGNPKTLHGLALGTHNWIGGAAVVGETGREIVKLPPHTQVIPNAKTEAMLNPSRGADSGPLSLDDSTIRRLASALGEVMGERAAAHASDAARNEYAFQGGM